MIKYRQLTIIISLFFVCSTTIAAVDEKPAIEATIQKFLANDLASEKLSADIRVDLVHIEGEAAIAAQDSDVVPEAFFPLLDPVIVVEGYSVHKISTVAANEAVVEITFQRVARTEGSNDHGDNPRIFIKEKASDEIVTYHLKKIESQWVVVNPPVPRVSRCNLISDYQSRIESTQEQLNNMRAGKGGYDPAWLPSIIKDTEADLEYKTKQSNTLLELGACLPQS